MLWDRLVCGLRDAVGPPGCGLRDAVGPPGVWPTGCSPSTQQVAG